MADDFLEAKHKRLDLLATVTGVFAWLALLYYLLLAGASYMEWGGWVGFRQFADQAAQQGPLYSVYLLLNIVDPVLRGVVYWLLLKGVSVGLRMIMETDINYRELRPRAAK